MKQSDLTKPDSIKLGSRALKSNPNPETLKFSRKNPYPAELLERIKLNGEGSAKETIHLEFKLEESALTYEAGDSLAVLAHNADDVVKDIITLTGLSPDSLVQIKDESVTLLHALTCQLDITTLSASVIKRYNEIVENKELENLLKPENKPDLDNYIDGREIIDLLQEYPAYDISADSLISIMRKLPARLYSIASSPKVHPEEVHLTVGVVRYHSHGRERKGVCSTYLAERIFKGNKAKVYVTSNKKFKLPANNETPIIMVGPGTGIAPFRAFIEERKATNAKGKNWLFFGDQHYSTDFLYQNEWEKYLDEGILTKLDVAFSRDQKEKIYVQDRMLEKSKELFFWIEQGAYFYVCGDANHMANDVDSALHKIIEKEGGLEYEETKSYVKKLKDEKRYLRDVY
ncbi:MAG: sulfite reductase subunit alpha [Verrucomicrobiota bacterium]|nr:sulfite reductase subunit alpha [Verrucomicrobiota bacterium]